MLVLTVLLSSISINVKAQGQDANYQWIGNDISTVIGNSNADMNKVYLYNVGTGKYLNVGDVWGTSINAYNVGLELNLNSVGTDTYTIQGTLTTIDGQYLGFLMLNLMNKLLISSQAETVYSVIVSRRMQM